VLPYQVPFHSKMVGTHVLNSRLVARVLEHLFQEFHQLADPDVLRRLLSRILESGVFPPWVDLLLSGHHPAA
jgi:hypothetical protein